MDLQLAWHAFVQHAFAFLPRLGLALLVLLASWVAGSSVQPIVGRLIRARGVDSGVVLFLSQSVRTIIVVCGSISALGTLGVDVTALVAGLGLTGFALGFAMKDLVSNALSGFLVVFYKPFTYGDHISVSALEGKVIEINARYTVLEAEGKWIYVPNSNLFTNPVIVTQRRHVELG